MQAPLRDRARWPWWLAAALAALSIAIWWRPWAGDVVVSTPALVPVPATAQRLPAAGPSRPAAAPAPAAVRAPALQLIGTAVGGTSSFATVRRTTDSQILLLRVGDRVDGLDVTAIEPGRIVLAGAAPPPIVIEAEATAAAAVPPVPTRAVNPPPASKVESPAWAEGEAPWDAGPDFRH